MLGRKLAARLATDGCLVDAPVAHLILVDAPSPSAPPPRLPRSRASLPISTGTAADLALAART